MDRRDFVASALAGMTLLGVGAAGSARAEDHTGHIGHFQKCAEACASCAAMCASCVAHCSGALKEGKKEHYATLLSCQDCADTCTAATKIMGRSGPYAMLYCQLCAEICARCAKECEAFPNDAHMKKCAEECRKCEAACREMLKK